MQRGIGGADRDVATRHAEDSKSISLASATVTTPVEASTAKPPPAASPISEYVTVAWPFTSLDDAVTPTVSPFDTLSRTALAVASESLGAAGATFVDVRW